MNWILVSTGDLLYGRTAVAKLFLQTGLFCEKFSTCQPALASGPASGLLRARSLQSPSSKTNCNYKRLWSTAARFPSALHMHTLLEDRPDPVYAPEAPVPLVALVACEGAVTFSPQPPVETIQAVCVLCALRWRASTTGTCAQACGGDQTAGIEPHRLYSPAVAGSLRRRG
jgi:hypothetical protein